MGWWSSLEFQRCNHFVFLTPMFVLSAGWWSWRDSLSLINKSIRVYCKVVPIKRKRLWKVAMESISSEGDAVIDGLGPDDEMIGNNSSNLHKRKPDSGLGPDGGASGGATPVAIPKSLGYRRGSCRIVPMVNSLRYADLSEKQKEEIKFPPRTFDYLRDDIRQNIIDLINFKILKQKTDEVNRVSWCHKLGINCNSQNVIGGLTLSFSVYRGCFWGTKPVQNKFLIKYC